MAKIIDFYNPTISGQSYSGFIKAANQFQSFGSEWASELGTAGLNALDSFIKLKIGHREVMDSFEPNDGESFSMISYLFYTYNYQLDGLFNLLIKNDGSESGYNPLDNVNEIRHEETDVDFDKGLDSIKFNKGEDSTTFNKGEDSITFKKGEEIDSTIKGAEKTTFSKGEDTITFEKGEEETTLEAGARKVTTKNPTLTETTTTEEKTTAFDTSAYDKDTDKSVVTLNKAANNVESDTDSVTDKSTAGERTDKTTNSEREDVTESLAREDSTTIGERTDKTTNSDREDITTNSSREDMTVNSERHDDTKTIYDVKRHGNIGVTTSFELISGDRKLHYYNFFNEVVNVIINELLKTCLWEV